MTTVPEAAAIDREGLRSFIRTTYAAGKVHGEEGREFSLRPHGIPEADGETLRDLAVREGAAHTIETGFGYGLSSLFLCEALAASGRGDARHVSMDPRQPGRDHAGLRTIREGGVAELVEFHAEGSELVLPRFVTEGRMFDFAFVDGDHRFEGAFIDLYYLHQLVQPGGLIVVDDVWMPAVRLAVTFFVTNFGLQVEPVRFSWGTYTGEQSRLWRQFKVAPTARMAVLRRPAELTKRPWNHFVPFADWETGNPSLLARQVAHTTAKLRALRSGGR